MGHIFSIQLGFKGGKGLATMVGALWLLPLVLWMMNFNWRVIVLILVLDGVFLTPIVRTIKDFGKN